jgi:hypothetical protein
MYNSVSRGNWRATVRVRVCESTKRAAVPLHPSCMHEGHSNPATRSTSLGFNSVVTPNHFLLALGPPPPPPLLVGHGSHAHNNVRLGASANIVTYNRLSRHMHVAPGLLPILKNLCQPGNLWCLACMDDDRPSTWPAAVDGPDGKKSPGLSRLH